MVHDRLGVSEHVLPKFMKASVKKAEPGEEGQEEREYRPVSSLLFMQT